MATTLLHRTDNALWSFDVYHGLLYAINRNGRPQQNQGGTDVHSFYPANLSSRVTHVATSLHRTDNNLWEFSVLGYHANPSDTFSTNCDFYAINRRGLSGTTEVHVFSARSGYQAATHYAFRSWHAILDQTWTFGVSRVPGSSAGVCLIGIAAQGASRSPEAHIYRLNNLQAHDHLVFANYPTDLNPLACKFAWAGSDRIGYRLYMVSPRGPSGSTEIVRLDHNQPPVRTVSSIGPTDNALWDFVGDSQSGHLYAVCRHGLSGMTEYERLT